MDLGKWYAANEFFSIPISEKNQEQFTFTWNRQSHAFTVLSKVYVNSPAVIT